MDDDNVVPIRPAIPELTRIACAECDESHWRIYSDGSCQCVECGDMPEGMVCYINEE